MSTTNEQVQPVAADAPAESPANADLESLQVALAAAETRATEGRDQALRALAELENIRKRAAKDIEQAHKYALEKFAGELIGVKDSLEMGLSASNVEIKDLLAGSEATLKLLAKAFEKAGVTEIIPEGQTFNPEFHEAMAMVPAADKVPNTVINVIQKGYQLNGRLLRPARVLVARAPD